MRLLIDTHYLIWTLGDGSELTARESAIIAEAAAIYVSAASLWELRTKWRSFDRHGKRKGSLDPAVALAACDTLGFHLVSLEPADSCADLSPVPIHNDPFDHMLLVHAQRIGARLMTRDRKLRTHPLALQL